MKADNKFNAQYAVKVNVIVNILIDSALINKLF